MSSLGFFGAAGTVTGPCALLDTDTRRCPIDRGSFQGNRRVRAPIARLEAALGEGR